DGLTEGAVVFFRPLLFSGDGEHDGCNFTFGRICGAQMILITRGMEIIKSTAKYLKMEQFLKVHDTNHPMDVNLSTSNYVNDTKHCRWTLSTMKDLSPFV
ncbi:hypothetical protein CEXT_276761, partial [Caerostris extrusa]